MPTITDVAIDMSAAPTKSVSLSWRQTFIRAFSATTQFLTWPFAFIFFNLVYKLSINGRENLKKVKGPFIIISNHVASYDSFLFRLVLGFKTPHLPLRFMAVSRFDYWYLNFLAYIGIIRVLYIMFGVFTVVPGRGLEENLKSAEYIISNNGGNIVIYPEGKIVKKNEIAPFKRGASVLAQKMQVPVLPISFRITGEEGLARKKMVVNIGEAFVVQDNMSEENVTKILFNSVSNLYNY